MNILVLLHGWGAGGSVWQRQIEAFSGKWRVHTPTLPCWEAAWVSDYLAGLKLQETVTVGWSLGGMLLLEALVKGGLKPAALVLVGVAASFCAAADHSFGQPPATVRAMRRGLRQDPEAVLAAFAARCLAPGEKTFQEEVTGLFKPAGVGQLAAGLDYLLHKDLRHLLPRVPLNPVLVQGEADEIVPPDQARALAQHLPGARLIVLPGAGHLPFVTRAAEFNEIVRDVVGEGQGCRAGALAWS